MQSRHLFQNHIMIGGCIENHFNFVEMFIFHVPLRKESIVDQAPAVDVILMLMFCSSIVQIVFFFSFLLIQQNHTALPIYQNTIAFIGCYDFHLCR